LSQRFNVLWMVTQLVEHVDYSTDHSVQATDDRVRIAQAHLLRLAIISFGVVQHVLQYILGSILRG
jgi:hypothetical protein